MLFIQEDHVAKVLFSEVLMNYSWIESHAQTSHFVTTYPGQISHSRVEVAVVIILFLFNHA